MICFSTFIKTRTLHRGETSKKLEPKKLTFLSRRRKLNAILPRFGGHKKFDLNQLEYVRFLYFKLREIHLIVTLLRNGQNKVS